MTEPGTEVGKVTLSTEEYIQVSQTMLELSQQRDEARGIAIIMRTILADMYAGLGDLDERLEVLPDWIYEHGVDS